MDLTASQLTPPAAVSPSPISVVARIRPFLAHEPRPASPCVRAEGSRVVTVDPSSGQREFYEFDAVFPQEVDNAGVYGGLGHLTEEIASSVPALFLSYGVTGAGKSFTLFGGGGQIGLFQLVVRDIFPDNCEISAVEVYLNCASDLLSQEPLRVLGAGADPLPGRRWAPLAHSNYEHIITSIMQNRETSATQNNSASSRSHCVIFVRGQGRFAAFADLAGSEPFQPDAPRLMQQEGAFIRTSLLMLDRSLRELRHMAGGRASSASFRSSALTMVLRPFLTPVDGRMNVQVCLVLNLHANLAGFAANRETLNLGLVTKNARQYVKTPLRISQSVRSVYNSCVCVGSVAGTAGAGSDVEGDVEYVKIRKEQWDGVLAQLEELAVQLEEHENDRETEILEQRNDAVQEMREIMEIEVMAERCLWIERIRELEAELGAELGTQPCVEPGMRPAESAGNQ